MAALSGLLYSNWTRALANAFWCATIQLTDALINDAARVSYAFARPLIRGDSRLIQNRSLQILRSVESAAIMPAGATVWFILTSLLIIVKACRDEYTAALIINENVTNTWFTE